MVQKVKNRTQRLFFSPDNPQDGVSQGPFRRLLIPSCKRGAAGDEVPSAEEKWGAGGRGRPGSPGELLFS